MTQPLRQENNALVGEMNHQTMRIEPWGKDCLRVRATRESQLQDQPWALLPPAPAEPVIEITSDRGLIRNGAVQAEVLSDGKLRFIKSASGEVLLEETPYRVVMPPSREFRGLQGGLWHIEVRFQAQEGERFYGLGQHTHGLLNQKGCVVELMQRNTQVSIPFMVSNRGYGFLWNNPAIGRVELGRDVTRWVAEATRQVDYVVMAGASYGEIMERYADVTGHPLELPEFAAGFWQCKLRYRTQEELLSVVREYKQRGLPLSVVVVDFFHWTMLGDWQFDPKFGLTRPGWWVSWKSMGVKLMVSIWPSVNPNSQNFEEMSRQGWLVRSRARHCRPDGLYGYLPGRQSLSPHTTTPPTLKRAASYGSGSRRITLTTGSRSGGWMPVSLSFIRPINDNLRYHLGNGLEVGNIYPMLHQQGFYDGMHSAGETDIVTLCRSAWAGSQRYGAAVWSGDIPSTFEMLQIQFARRPEHRHERHPLVDDRHRRLLWRGYYHRLFQGADRTLVPVRPVLPALPPARHAPA